MEYAAAPTTIAAITTKKTVRHELIGERITIHAAKRPPIDLLHELAALGHDRLDLPLGAVLGTAVVIDFHRTELIAPTLARRELAFGDYALGRWGRRLNEVVMLPTPVPARGK